MTMSDVDLTRLDADITEVREALIVACGRDGKNGRLSQTRESVAEIASNLSGLRKQLWGLALTLCLAFAGTGFKSCVDAAQRATTYDLKIQQLEAAVADLSKRVHP